MVYSSDGFEEYFPTIGQVRPHNDCDENMENIWIYKWSNTNVLSFQFACKIFLQMESERPYSSKLSVKIWRLSNLWYYYHLVYFNSFGQVSEQIFESQNLILVLGKIKIIPLQNEPWTINLKERLYRHYSILKANSKITMRMKERSGGIS